MRTTIKSTTVLVLALTLGLHWALLQTVAWTGMIISNSQAHSLGAAICMTFDGQHPCCLCKIIKKCRSEEKQQEKVAPENKMPPAVVWEAPRFYFKTSTALIPAVNTTGAGRAEAPPKPRPRGLPGTDRA